MNVIIVEPTLIIELLTENIVALTSEFFNFEFNSALKRTSNTPHIILIPAIIKIAPIADGLYL